MPAERLEGGESGRWGHLQNLEAVVVFLQCTMCSGVFLRPQEQSSLASSCANLV